MKKIGFDRLLLPVIFSLAWPTMLEQVMQTAVQYIDTAMVGALGTTATAAVGSTTTVNWLINGTLSALGTGFLAYVSQAYGRGEKEIARRASALSVLFVIVAGSVFTVLPLFLSSYIPTWMQVDPAIQQQAETYFFILYTPMLLRAATIIFGTVLRAAGDTRTPMQAGIVVNVANIILNFLLIYPARKIIVLDFMVQLPGMGMGVVGAAVASAVSYALGGIVITIAFFRQKEVSPRGLPVFWVEREMLYSCLKIALPNMLQRFCTSMGYVFFAAMINSLGSTATAAHTIANTVESAFYIPGYGMMTAAGTLTGNCIGAGDKERLHRMKATLLSAEFLMMMLSGALLLVFAPQLAGLFTKDVQVVALCSLVLRMVAVSEPFYGISIVIEGMLLGAGETLRPMIFNISSMWGIRIFGTFVCIVLLHFGLAAAWGCMIAGNMVLMVLFVWYAFRRVWE